MESVIYVLCFLIWLWWLLYSIFGKDEYMLRVALFGASLIIMLEYLVKILEVM